MIFSRLRVMLSLGNRVLGINARNIDFVYQLNERRSFLHADDKLKTKAILKENRIPHPATLSVFRCHRDFPGWLGLRKNLTGLS